jgi:hypothetical protein
MQRIGKAVRPGKAGQREQIGSTKGIFAPPPWPPARGAGRGGRAQNAVLPIRSLEARQKIGEIEELLVADRVEHITHRCVVAASHIVLVRTQRFHEVVLTLASQPRHLLGTGKIRYCPSFSLMR